MSTRRWIRRAAVGLAMLASAPVASAQTSGGAAPHSLDGLEELSGEIVPTIPELLGVFTLGVSEPLHRDLRFGGEGLFRAGYHVGGGLYLGGGFALLGNPADATVAMPEGTFFQFQVLFSMDWVLPLHPETDPWGYGPSFRLGLAPGIVRGLLQQSRSDRDDLRDQDLDLETQFWGAVVRAEVAFDLPIYRTHRQRLFFTVGLNYQWGLGEARLRLRDKTGGSKRIREEDRLRLDSFAVFIGFTARL